ncbi:sec-independent protein translocase protein TatB [Shimia isoporae]|uniref:Sec-independent protein translocase protein TatB n=1 Tax=Shimia isoporae TaxID=647720 RepID=A0A4R1NXC5_9RHOB|nr:Sec-independent protein translocase protein TatB [Shimia isoporae]TCL09822.1 sec-independent protein translocase protein TatB [Shimia isoporae]
MFDLGLPELLVIGVVALIVVGPKDLPVMFRAVGRFVGKAKGMAREFSSAMNQAADQAGVKDVTDGLKSATDGLNKVSNPMKAASDALKETTDDFKKSMSFDPDSETGKLAAERAEAVEKIRKRTQEVGQAKLDAEAKAREEEMQEAAKEVRAKREAEAVDPVKKDDA